jgi:hypothetical protein
MSEPGRFYDVVGAPAAVTAERHVHGYLGRFFAPLGNGPRPAPALGLEVRATGSATTLTCRRPGGPPRVLTVPGMDDTVAARKLLRAWRVTRDEDSGVGLLHAAAFRHSEGTVVLLGPPHAGKTTLLLDAVLRHGVAGQANDALAVALPPPGAGLRARSANLPSIVGIRELTARTFATELRAASGHRAGWAPRAGTTDYFYPEPFLGPPRGWQPLDLNHGVVLALTRFAPHGTPAEVRPAGPDQVRQAVRQTLDSWPLRADIEPMAATVDGLSWSRLTDRSMRLLDRLITHARLVEFDHHGCAGPLITHPASSRPQEAICR